MTDNHHMRRRLATALARSETVDITTIGRRSGRPRRIEIWMFHFEDLFVVTGTPGRRDWMANVLAHPRVTVHVHHPERFDIVATATLIEDDGFRRRFFSARRPAWYRTQVELDRLVDHAPMIALNPQTE